MKVTCEECVNAGCISRPIGLICGNFIGRNEYRRSQDLEKTCGNCAEPATERESCILRYVCRNNSRFRPINNEETGIKHDNGKPPVGLLFEDFPRALKKVALVSGHGCKEYGRHNWDKLENGQERYLDAMCRHILDRAIEGDVSDETGLYHIAQAVWNGLAILELYSRSKEPKNELP